MPIAHAQSFGHARWALAPPSVWLGSKEEQQFLLSGVESNRGGLCIQVGGVWQCYGHVLAGRALSALPDTGAIGLPPLFWSKQTWK